MAPELGPETLRADLLYLRKGVGFTPERLATRTALIGVLGGDAERPEVHHERLQSAIQSLHDQDADLLMDVFRLSPQTKDLASLGARRDYIGQRLRIGRDAVADRDAAAIERLLSQLITGWYPKSPIPIRVPESHNGIVNYSVHERVYLQDGRFTGSDHHLRYFAVFDGAEHVTIDTVGTQPVEVSGDFEVRTVPVRRGQQHQFYRSIPMERGKTYDLHYRTAGWAEDDEHLLTQSGLAFHEPTRLATFEAVFRGRRPTWIWWYTGLTHLEQPGEPYRQTLLTPNANGLVGIRLRDLYGGLFHGLAWEW